MGRKKASISNQLADLDLKLLKIFKSVVDNGGVTAAEIELNLANSTISNYLSDLETRLGTVLCERGRSGFKLTEHGHTVYDATLELFDAINHFQNRLNDSQHQLKGSIHIAITEHVLGRQKTSITETLSAFIEKAPNVSIKITTMQSDSVTSAVLNENIDIGVTVVSEKNTDLYHHPLFEEKMLIYCAKNHPLYQNKQAATKKALQEYAFVESPRLMPGREIHPDMKSWRKPSIAHHQEARAALILSGKYLGFLPEHLVEEWGLNQHLMPINLYSYKNTIAFIYKNQKKQNAIISAFLSCLLK